MTVTWSAYRRAKGPFGVRELQSRTRTGFRVTPGVDEGRLAHMTRSATAKPKSERTFLHRAHVRRSVLCAIFGGVLRHSLPRSSLSRLLSSASACPMGPKAVARADPARCLRLHDLEGLSREENRSHH